MKRSFGIDLVRTVSIILVIARHYGFTKGFNYGYYGIEFLFVVSGFLIGQILFNDFYSSDKIEISSLKRFMIRRWFRILPLYYLAILLRFAFDHSIGWNIFYYIFFLQNHFYGITFYPETWTLVIDEWFYLIIPVILFLFMRFVSFEKNAVAYFIIGIIVVINLLRILWVSKSNTPFEGLVGNVPFRQDTLLIGVLLAYSKMKFKNLFSKMNSIPFCIIAFLALIIYISIIYFIRIPDDTINNYFWTRTINFLLTSVVIASTLPFIENSITPFKIKPLNIFNLIIVWGSKLSYSLYLFHSEVYRFSKFLFSSLSASALFIKLLALTFTVVICYFLYQFFEKKFLILRDKYFPDKPYFT